MKHHILEYDLEPGDLVFLPMGWIHSLESMNESLSISFTDNIPVDINRYDNLDYSQKILTIFKNTDLFLETVYNIDILLEWHKNWIINKNPSINLIYLYNKIHIELIKINNDFEIEEYTKQYFYNISFIQYNHIFHYI